MATVLVLDPDPAVRSLLELLLSRLGHSSLAEREVVDGAQPDLLLLEPVSRAGVRLAERLRERLPQLPVLCVSIAPPSDESTDLRPVAHVMKPFRRSDLESALERALAAPVVA
jgi:CheY-like chemotaxis protein